jgi:hypothetical protein
MTPYKLYVFILHKLTWILCHGDKSAHGVFADCIPDGAIENPCNVYWQTGRAWRLNRRMKRYIKEARNEKV